MDSAGGGSDVNLPPPPPRPPGMVPQTLADVTGGGSSPEGREGSEPPGKKLKPMPIQKFSQMKRPGFGTKGQAVQLLCNHFKVTFKPSKPVYHYNVSIEPDTDNKGLNRKVMEGLHATYGQELQGKRFAYDGEKGLFVVGPLELPASPFRVFLEDDPRRGGRRRAPVDDNAGQGPFGREFFVTLTQVSTIDMRAIDSVLRGERDDRVYDALRVLDIMMREHAAKRDYLLLKESYFHPSIGQVSNIGEGVVMWKGFHVSFRPTSGGLSLNFDLSTTLLIQPVDVLQFLHDHFKKPPASFNQLDWQKARSVLKGLMVETKNGGRKHKISGFSQESCARQTFPKRAKGPDGTTVDSVEVTVADYFAAGGFILKYPNMLALNGGRTNKPCYLPIELCKIIPGQRYKRSLSTFQRQAQIEQTRQAPDVRTREIHKVMDVNKYNDDELVKEFNVNIDPTMKKVQGRILDSPKLIFGNRTEEKIRDGKWDYRGKTMKKPVQIPNWGVVCFRGGRFQVDAQKVATEMKNICATKGMKMGDFVLFEEEMEMKNQPPAHRVKKVIAVIGQKLGKFVKPYPPEREHEMPFILAILPEKKPDLYIPFKKQCETEIGIVTQCIVPPKGQVNAKYLTSVALKINLKRGGYNSVLAFEELKQLPKISSVPTIIFGLDVSHGSPGDASSPSVAAAVATVDWPFMSRFTTSIRAQASKTEIIKGLYENDKEGMVKDLLMNFYNFESRCIKPQQILIFRDGVSESQFDQVLEEELVAFKRACHGINPNYCPKITMVIVQKRHHTRFFPADGKGNVKPGTIVDRDPCHPGNNDFYLMSHVGIIGTTRPTHYHVLYDEIKFSPDELQQISNFLCYSYTRCTSAVSVVAPAYYAHLAAQHCRNFVQENYDSGSDSSLMSARVAKAIASLPKLREYVTKKMFYA